LFRIEQKVIKRNKRQQKVCGADSCFLYENDENFISGGRAFGFSFPFCHFDFI